MIPGVYNNQFGQRSFSAWTFVTSVGAAVVDTGIMSITIPGTIATGDLMVFMNTATGVPSGSYIANTPPPATFTTDITDWGGPEALTGRNRFSCCVSHKILLVSDLGTTITATTPLPGGRAMRIRGAALFFRPDYPLQSVDTIGAQQSDSSGTPTTLTLSTPTNPAICLGTSYSFDGTVTPSGTLVSSGTTVSMPDSVVKGNYFIQNTGFVSETLAVNDSGSYTYHNCLVLQGT